MGIRSAVKARLARPETLSVQPVKRRAMDEAGNRLRDAGVIFLWYSCSIVANSASKLVLTHGFRHPPTLAISQFALACACVLARETHARARGGGGGDGAIATGLRLVRLVRVHARLGALLGAALVGASVCHRVALLFVHVSFAHTVKATQPLFVFGLAHAAGLAPRLNSRARLGLMLAILGVGLSARTEFAFDWRGLLAAEASALAIAVGSVGQKRALLAPSPKREGGGLLAGGAAGADAGAGATGALSTTDVFFLTNACGTLLLLPYWLLFEARVLLTADAESLSLVALNALAMVAQHYVSLSVLARMSPVSHSLVNLFKRVVVIGASVAVFRNPVSPLNALGMLLASVGVACYSHASRAAPRRARADDEAALLESGRADAGSQAV